MKITFEIQMSITPHTADAWFLELPQRVCEAVDEELKKINPENSCHGNYFEVIRIGFDELDNAELKKLNSHETRN